MKMNLLSQVVPLLRNLNDEDYLIDTIGIGVYSTDDACYVDWFGIKSE